MAEKEIEGLLQELSEAVVFAEVTDLPALAGIHTQFESIAEWAAKGSHPKLEQAAKAVVELIGATILKEVDKPEEVLDIIGRSVTAMQSAVRDGQPDQEVEYPKELGMPSADDASTSTGEEPLSLPPAVDKTIFTDFISRQPGNLDELEEQILAAESSSDENAIAAVRRIVHTLKGEAGLLGLQDVEKLCHTIEDSLDQFAPNTIVDSLLIAKDWMSRLFCSYSNGGTPPEPVQTVLDQLKDPKAKTIESQGQQQEQTQEPPTETPEEEEEEVKTKVIEGDTDLIGDFVSEAQEHLDICDVQLLAIETNPNDEDAGNAVFRAFHTIKGVAGFLALDDILDLAHQSESLLDQARKGNVVLAGDVIDATFDAVDLMKRLINDVSQALTSDGVLTTDPDLKKLLVRLKALAEGKPPSATEPPSQVVADTPSAKLGEMLIESGLATKESVENALNEQEEEPQAKKVGELLIESAAVSSASVQEALKIQHERPEKGKVGEILVEMDKATEEDVEAAIKKQKLPPQKEKLGEKLVKSGEVAAKDVAQALRGQKSRQGQVQIKESLKVDAERLDALIDAIGELVIAESMVYQSIAQQEKPSQELVRHLGQLRKISRELQEMGMSLRMVPVRATFQKMARLVRDLAKKSGKKVNFVMNGEDTELDKSVVDKIGDPLVHMIRNAVDHGLESSPDERVKAGKRPEGRVELKAFHKGGSIHIEVEDDGRGLDREAILKKAIERNVIKKSERDSLSDREVWNLIFEAGFSTAKKVTDVSGRGVGMDVVRRNIEALRGQVEITSEAGKGSVFSMRLPLTLAIIDGMIVSVGGERLIIPTLSIVISLRPEKDQISTVVGKGEVLSLQGSLIPLFRMSRLFNIAGAKQVATEALVVVVEDEGRKVGLMCDALLGQQQIVIKSLGEALQGLTGISGGAIMPDGTVGLIMDVGGAVKLASEVFDE